MSQKVIKTGNSMAVTIPSTFARDLGIRTGDFVTVKTELNKNCIIYSFRGSKQLPLLENISLSRKKK